MVSTTYFGASAETLQKSVIAPLEEAINGVEDMTYMTSTATNAGTVSIMVYFKQGTDPDMATVNVQNRVSKATGQLPAEVTQVGVTTTKRQTSMLQIFSIYSPDDSYDEGFLANYLSINLKPEILRFLRTQPSMSPYQAFHSFLQNEKPSPECRFQYLQYHLHVIPSMHVFR